MESEDRSQVLECRLRGILKKSDKKENCVVGDKVEVSADNAIIAIEPRKNIMERPLVANIDNILIQFSCKDPLIDFEKLNILLLNSFYYKISPVIIINKIDLCDEDELAVLNERLCFLQKINIPCFYISQKNNIGIDAVKDYIKDKISAFCGPSGVGKSSLTNEMQDIHVMDVGETSKRLKRGKNTTTETRLIHFGDKGYIIDTPGFSSVELPNIKDESELRSLFPEIENVKESCRFLNCHHINEPGCVIKDKVKNGEISLDRYDFYKRVYEKLKDTRWNKYGK